MARDKLAEALAALVEAGKAGTDATDTAADNVAAQLKAVSGRATAASENEKAAALKQIKRWAIGGAVAAVTSAVGASLLFVWGAVVDRLHDFAINQVIDSLVVQTELVSASGQGPAFAKCEGGTLIGGSCYAINNSSIPDVTLGPFFLAGQGDQYPTKGKPPKIVSCKGNSGVDRDTFAIALCLRPKSGG